MHDTISINIIHVRKSLLKFPRCPSLVSDPNMQELDHSRARANDLQKAQEEQLEEIIRISKELESFEPFVPLSLWFCIIGWSCKNRPYFCKFRLRLMNLRPDRSNSQRLTGSFFWCWCFVSLSQERDECSEEIIRMRGLDEKYEAEISQLAKDSQVVSSFKWEHCNIAIGRSMALFGTFPIQGNRSVLLASNIQ